MQAFFPYLTTSRPPFQFQSQNLLDFAVGRPMMYLRQTLSDLDHQGRLSLWETG